MTVPRNQETEGTVRPARPEDAARLAALCRQLGYAVSEEQVRRRLGPILQDEDQAILVAEGPEGQVAGWVHVFFRQLLVMDPHAHLGGLVVDEGHRRRGLGRLLMEGAEAWARARGCGAVLVRTNVVREEAPLFYEGIGYRRVKTSWTYWKDL